MTTPSQSPVDRVQGVTPTERYLGRLADRTFLSLWSYHGVYRDQGPGKQGKEICDLLVVFEDHVLIFSDKDNQYPDSGNPDLDWQRWYRRAIEKSADQVWGAERWIRAHPDRVFLDRAATQPFPYELPPADRAKFHRIVVAHDTSGRRRQLIGGSGSHLVMPDIVGDDHTKTSAEGGHPFAIGQLDPSRGFVHVLDDASLNMVLGTLDTITDFVAYLEKKERFIRSGRLTLAYGEEDLVGLYLKNLNDQDVHDFVLPDDGSRMVLEEGHFANYLKRPESFAKREADRISEIWDALIEEFAEHVRAGTLFQATDHSLATQERILRILAREPRVWRRMLSRGMFEKLRDTPADHSGIRSMGPSFPGDPWYVFVCAPREWGAGEEEYRERRATFLQGYCKVLRLMEPDAHIVVGIATESGRNNPGRSHDLALLDGRDWTEGDYEEARQIQEATGFMKRLRKLQGSETEYPVERYFEMGRKVGRNEPCRCGSGMKYKRCCGR